MPRPSEQKLINFTIDGREVVAPENEMLVDAAKRGDVEIPVFCYEPKLGQPVGACRMCLVEIEGIPKLQTGCSTPVKDGMVVHTQSPRAKEAQESVVEFLLTNHPLDCPVCDRGGECPLQDISYGWGPGTSRFTEAKRHFEKPVELSPKITIDRERCILCYRCVRFSQEISEDYELILLERGADTYVATFDDRPYDAPFSGNIIELCPVGALTSTDYRFRARPWEIEQSGTICTLCPSQCNVSLTVRDDRAIRVLARDNTAVDDGWLCDRGRFAYPPSGGDRITEPLVRDGDRLRPTSWEHALTVATDGLGKARASVGALAGGEATNEEGFLLARLLRETLDSPDIDSRGDCALSLETLRALHRPQLQASVTDIEFANTVLLLDCSPIEDSPILDLRIRKGVRRNGVRLIEADALPLQIDEGDLGAAGEDIVIVYSERLLSGPAGEQPAAELLALAERLGLSDRAGAGLLELPAGSNGRGLREVGVLPNAAAGLGEPERSGRNATAIAQAAASGELSALYLLRVDPVAEYDDEDLWQRALAATNTVVAHATSVTDSLNRYATVVFPAETYAEKEGTTTHPDGRLQRLRPAVGHASSVRMEWQLIAEVARRLGGDLDALTCAAVTERISAAVPFYTDLTLEEIGGQGVRWQERPAAIRYEPVGAPEK